MQRIFEELDYHQTPLGELTLRRKHVAVMGGVEVYEVKLGDSFLMSSMFHAVEDALAVLGLRELKGTDWDVVVGGLGLGYTAVAALRHPQVRALNVIEYLRPVIGWHERGLAPLGPTLTADARCTLREGNFFELAKQGTGFGTGRRSHAVLLDIDHSPRNLLHPRNAGFYSEAGLVALSHELHPGGVFALWSDDPPDARFIRRLERAFVAVRAEVVTFPNPMLGCESASTVYIARKADAPAA